MMASTCRVEVYCKKLLHQKRSVHVGVGRSLASSSPGHEWKREKVKVAVILSVSDRRSGKPWSEEKWKIQVEAKENGYTINNVQ